MLNNLSKCLPHDFHTMQKWIDSDGGSEKYTQKYSNTVRKVVSSDVKYWGVVTCSITGMCLKRCRTVSLYFHTLFDVNANGHLCVCWCANSLYLPVIFCATVSKVFQDEVTLGFDVKH